MNTTFDARRCACLRSNGARFLASFLMLLATLSLPAQDKSTEPDTQAPRPVPVRALALPEAPEIADVPSSGDDGAREPQTVSQPARADHFAKYIETGQTVEKLSGFDKVLLGARHSTSSFAAATWVVSAGYEQLLTARPNYGQTFKGYAQRVGAAAARNVSDGIFSDSILATVLHEDPRYYKLGPGHPLNVRLKHALLQPLLTRTDGGTRTINFAQIGGNLAGAALTDAYYPPVNRTTGATLVTFGTSMGGGAIGYLVNEFFSIHLPVAR